MFKANRFLAIIALFLFVVVMGSCGGGGGGGGGDGGGTGTTPPTTQGDLSLYSAGDIEDPNFNGIGIDEGVGISTLSIRKYDLTITSETCGPMGTGYQGFAPNNCTEWVAVRRCERGDAPVIWRGNGGQWLANAAAVNYETGTTPKVGTIAVFQLSYDPCPGEENCTNKALYKYGHVAYVESVNGNEWCISEYNYLNPLAYGERCFSPEKQAPALIGFIYGPKTLPSTDTVPPSTPIDLTGNAISSSHINLSWTASTDNFGVAGYKINRNGYYLKSVPTASTSDTGLSPSTGYCYTVSSYDTAGNESAQSSQRCITTQSEEVINLSTLRWPLDGEKNDRQVSQGYGDNWTDKYGNCMRYCGGICKRHTGVDLSAGVGDTVYASENGIAIVLDSGSCWKKTLIIQHNGFATAYLHIDPAANLSNGSFVTKGKPIGTVADISACSGSHLHYNIWIGPYLDIIQRGALPEVNGDSDWDGNTHTYCLSDPTFSSPGNKFIDPWPLTYEYSSQQTFTLTVNKTGSGSGTVTSSPSGINCGATCSASFNQGATVTLTASPASGSAFAGWSGACSGTGTCTMIMDANKSVTATFTSGGYSISGRVTLNGSGLSGVTITLTGTGATSTTTDSNGNYAFGSAQNGSYTITPSKSGYTFTPSSRSIAVNNANLTGQDFTATQTTGGILSVSPSDRFDSSGPQGGPFTPSSKTYALSNTGGSSFNWTASKGQSWVSLSSTSGTLSPGGSTTVTVSINSNANSLSPSNYVDTVSFTNTTNGNGNTTRTVNLTVTYSTPTITVGPTSLNFGGVQVGTCSTAVFAIQHVLGTGPASGTVSASPNPPFSILSGSSFSVSNGSAANVTVQFCPTSSGTFNGTATVSSSANFTGTNTVTLTGTGTALGGVLSVTPSERFDSSGTQGGPFSPPSKTYTLSNTGGSSINWTASKGQSWVSLSSTSGTLSPSGSTTVTVSINTNANSLSPGNYVDIVNFTNTTNGNGNTTRTVNLTVNYSTPTITVGPTSLNFGSVQVGTCSTAVFAIQHVTGTGPASGTVSASPNPPFSILSGSSFSVSNGSAANVTVQFCPTTSGTFNGTATVSSSANFTGTNTVTLTGTGVDTDWWQF